MTRTPFKLRSGNSPVKQGGLLLNLLKTGAKKVFSKKGVTTGLAAGATDQALSDNTKNKSTVEKVLRAADEWGPTMGAVSAVVDTVVNAKPLDNKKGKYNKYLEWKNGKSSNYKEGKSVNLGGKKPTSGSNI